MLTYPPPSSASPSGGIEVIIYSRNEIISTWFEMKGVHLTDLSRAEERWRTRWIMDV
ncbi:MAG: hypothetical protein METHAR1v1_880021 [Methanothrix sp.]|nr:MAG: hypothetical protein METHAR1v1_880021 [Methanothrix sp.]